MLKILYIKNFALIDEIEVEFDEGFNVITGETGSGKTILLKAIKVVLGDRSSAEYVRAGEKKALIRAAFQIDDNNSTISEYLDNIGVELSDDMLVFSREINSSGRSLCRINGQVVPLSMYKKAGVKMLDIHSQHDQSLLLNKEFHRELLDAYGKAELMLQKNRVRQLYYEWKETRDKFDELKSKSKDAARQLDIIKFQINEIESANLEQDEDEKLAAEKNILNNAEKITVLVSIIHKNLYAGDGEYKASAVDLISESINALQELVEYDDKLSGLLKSLESAMYAVEDAAREVSGFQDNVEYDVNRLNYVESRLNEIERLKKKYGDSVNEILEYYKNLQEQLDDMTLEKGEIEKLEQEVNDKFNLLNAEAKKLSELRKRTAEYMQKNILKELKDLDMAKIRFNISFNEKPIDQDGLDDVQFLMSANPGESLKPLNKIASGGELSRFMLALKCLIADTAQTSTMVFDELDTGVGGNVLYAIGKKMFQVSNYLQVITVTHSPQIASFADTHFLVKKHTDDKKTYTKIVKLNAEEKLYEIARMLGGEEMNAALKHSQEMLATVNDFKKKLT